MASTRCSNALLSLNISRTYFHHIPVFGTSWPATVYRSFPAASPGSSHRNLSSLPSPLSPLSPSSSDRRTEPLHVIVGMSGGVDSSVTAAILQHAGFKVTGLFMKNWNKEDEQGAGLPLTPCPTDQDYLSAQEVAKHLNIPLLYKEFEKEYWTDVFVPWIELYRQGYTPNPDVWCNRYIKFGQFREYCLQTLKSDCIATGHYGQIYPPIHNPWVPLPPEHDTLHSPAYPRLYSAVDGSKDQSDFLSLVPGKSLQKVILPVGRYTKPYVRYLAEHIFKLPSAKRKDSYGICFIGKRPLNTFLAEYLDTLPEGTYINIETQQPLGICTNALSLTVGQSIKVPGLPCKHYVIHTGVRKREEWKTKILSLRSKKNDAGDSGKKDITVTNPIYVCPGLDHPALFSNAAIVKIPNFNFIDTEDITKDENTKIGKASVSVFPRMYKEALERYTSMQTKLSRMDGSGIKEILTPAMNDIIHNLRKNKDTIISVPSIASPAAVPSCILPWLPIYYRDRHKVEEIHKGKVTIIHETEWIIGWIISTQPHISVSELRTYLENSSRTPVHRTTTNGSEDYRLMVSFDLPHRAVTPGQTLVLYSANAFTGEGFDTEKEKNILSYVPSTIVTVPETTKDMNKNPNENIIEKNYDNTVPVWPGSGRQCYGGGLIEDTGPSWWELGYTDQKMEEGR